MEYIQGLEKAKRIIEDQLNDHNSKEVMIAIAAINKEIEMELAQYGKYYQEEEH